MNQLSLYIFILFLVRFTLNYINKVHPPPFLFLLGQGPHIAHEYQHVLTATFKVLLPTDWNPNVCRDPSRFLGSLVRSVYPRAGLDALGIRRWNNHEHGQHAAARHFGEAWNLFGIHVIDSHRVDRGNDLVLGTNPDHFYSDLFPRFSHRCHSPIHYQGDL